MEAQRHQACQGVPQNITLPKIPRRPRPRPPMVLLRGGPPRRPKRNISLIQSTLIFHQIGGPRQLLMETRNHLYRNPNVDETHQPLVVRDPLAQSHAREEIHPRLVARGHPLQSLIERDIHLLPVVSGRAHRKLCTQQSQNRHAVEEISR